MKNKNNRNSKSRLISRQNNSNNNDELTRNNRIYSGKNNYVTTNNLNNNLAIIGQNLISNLYIFIIENNSNNLNKGNNSAIENNENYFSGANNDFISNFNPNNYSNFQDTKKNIFPSPAKIFSNYYLSGDKFLPDDTGSKIKANRLKDFNFKDKLDSNQFIKYNIFYFILEINWIFSLKNLIKLKIG